MFDCKSRSGYCFARPRRHISSAAVPPTFVIHLGELLNPGKTDHLALREKLGKNKTVAQFLFYDIVKN